MMEIKDGQGSEQMPNEMKPSQPSKAEHIKNIPNDNKTGTNTSTGAEEIQSEPTKIIIVADKRKNTQAAISNIISGIAVLLAASAFYYTYLLFGETKRANKTSKDALELAQQQYVQNQKDNVNAQARQATKDSSSTVNNRKKFILDSTTTQAQIDALNESRKQFTVANKPYLQVDNIRLDTFQVNKEITISFDVKNLGNYPVKIIENKNGLATKVVPPDTINSAYQTGNSNYTSPIITKDNPATIILTDNRVLTNDRFNLVSNGYWWIYCYGDIKYKNLITGTVETYSYMFKVKPGQMIHLIYF